MNEQMGKELQRAVAELNQDAAVRAVLLRGEGKAFASGGDFEFIAARTLDRPESNQKLLAQFYRRYLSIHELKAPSIAVLHGPAVGAGLCLAMACDIRLAAAETRLSVNFVRLGIHPGMGATYLLRRLVGPAKAAELLLTGSSFDAAEALRIGLVNQVLPRDQLLEAANRMAQKIALGAPLSVQRTKASLERAEGQSLETVLDHEAYAQALDFSTEDAREGVAAAAEKRRPSFNGS